MDMLGKSFRTKRYRQACHSLKRSIETIGSSVSHLGPSLVDGLTVKIVMGVKIFFFKCHAESTSAETHFVGLKGF